MLRILLQNHWAPNLNSLSENCICANFTWLSTFKDARGRKHKKYLRDPFMVWCWLGVCQTKMHFKELLWHSGAKWNGAVHSVPLLLLVRFSGGGFREETTGMPHIAHEANATNFSHSMCWTRRHDTQWISRYLTAISWFIYSMWMKKGCGVQHPPLHSRSMSLWSYQHCKYLDMGYTATPCPDKA